jgi:DHA1 family bicyclomycin/chloramphenicol resistance-like MFS transporter
LPGEFIAAFFTPPVVPTMLRAMNTGLASKRRFVLVLGVLTGLAAVSIDMSLPAIPAMVEALQTNMATGQQIVGLFLAGIAVGQLPAGLLSDRVGRMPVLYAGVGIFTVGGIVSAASNSIEIMLLGRFVQGIGSSVGVVVSRAIVRDIASGATAARLLSVMVMIFTAAPMLAPLLGAFLVLQWGWRMPFIVIAVFGAFMMYSINAALRETRTPSRDQHILQQLWSSLREFLSRRQSLLGVLLVLLPTAGFMSLITGSAAVVMDIYHYSTEAFGLMFALVGVAILSGSSVNRHLLLRFNALRMIGLGCVLMGISALQMLAFLWISNVPFWWLWGNVCLFMFSTGFILPNATALALDPVPNIAGAAASIIGTIQNVAGAASAILSGLLYDGTIRNITLVMGIFGVATFLTFSAHRFILGGESIYGEAPTDT